MNTPKYAAAAAALVLAGFGAPALAQSTAGNLLRAAGAVADMVMPKPVVVEGQVLSPFAVASMLGAQHYRVNDMRRQGYAYAVDATGPRGNRVIMLIDGRSGVLLGQKVVRWAPNVQRVTVAPRGGWNDAWEFGAVIPARGFDNWAPIGATVWTRPAPRTIATAPSYAAYRAAVPYRKVAVTRNGRTVARPGSHPGYRVKSNDGRVIAAQNKAEEAEYARMAAENDADAADLAALDANDRANVAEAERDDANDTAEAALNYADEQSAALAEAQQTIADQQQQIEDTQNTVDAQNQAIEDRDQQLVDQSQAIKGQQQQIDEDQKVIDAADGMINERDQQIEQQGQAIDDQQNQIDNQQQEIQQDDQLIDEADQMITDDADQDPPGDDGGMEFSSDGGDAGDPGAIG